MSIDLGDETLQIFLEESREHLEGIENDLLAIEEAGENVDDELVNKVFRDVHSVKGGAGFFAFDKIKELAHAMENVLGLMRKRELAPSPELISLLLENADILTGMLNNLDSMVELDISSQVAALNAVLTGSLPEEKKDTVEKMVEVCLPDGRKIFAVSEFEMEAAKTAESGGENVYLLIFDMIRDIQRKGKTPWDIISDLLTLTAFVDSKLDLESVGTLDGFSEDVAIPFYALVSSSMDAGLMEDFLELERSQIHQVAGELWTSSIPESAEEPAAPLPDAAAAAAAASAPDTVTKTDEPEKSQEQEEALLPAAQPAATPTPATAATGEPDKSSKGTSSQAEGSIRVGVKVIDQLMTLAGELVLARNQLVQSVSSESMDAVENVSQRVDLVTTELQDAIMSTRMQSIDIVFGKFQRIVRDLSRNLGKKVDLVLEGQDVDLDKTIIEAIGDPLTHLVRNSVDHGIETIEERRQAGKPEAGTLRLSAAHKAGQVVIEIEDDGAGINPVRVRDKALSMGLYTQAQLEEMSEQALVRLIFHPGFSTAKAVTDVSGRGVGMDVVHSNLSKLGGVVDLDSVSGQGTTVRITLPLTLAIIPSLLVSVENEQYALPQLNLVELVRISSREVKDRIERIGEAAVIRLRGELLPLVRLSDILEIPLPTSRTPGPGEHLPGSWENLAPQNSDQENNEDDEYQDYGVDEEAVHAEHHPEEDSSAAFESAANIAVVAAGDFHYGLIVDNLLDSAEIVVKPLGNHLRSCRTYAGATILGDGHVALILDVNGIGQKVRATAQEAVEQAAKAKRKKEIEDFGHLQSLLLVENGPDERFAIPLGLVERIAKIDHTKIETKGGKRAMQYRGGTLPLLAIEDVADVTPREETKTVYVIVFRVTGRELGLMVSRILDITDSSADVDECTHRQPGVFGSLILNEITTLLLDIQGLVPGSAPTTLITENAPPPPEAAAALETGDDGVQTILVVEDSKFFLNQIKTFVEEAGFQSLTAMDGQNALQVLEEHQGKVDLVLTDIEMPVMDGFVMTEKIRSDDRFKNIPIIAVTSVMGEEAEDRGRAVGIDEYMIKLDRELILERTKHYLEQGRPA